MVHTSSSDRKAGKAGVNHDGRSHVLHSVSSIGALRTPLAIAARDTAAIAQHRELAKTRARKTIVTFEVGEFML